MDRFHELQTFIAVAEAGGFSAAAHRTGMSQSSVSKAIAALEKRLGVALFVRSTRRVTLTDQGERYYERTKPLMEEIDGADNELATARLDVSGLIRIATSHTLARLHVVPLLPDLLTMHPGLQIDIVISDLVRDMADDRIDLAIRGGQVDQPDAVVRKVTSTPLVCVGSRRYFDQHGIPTTPAELGNHNCLTYGGHMEPNNWRFTGPEGPLGVAVRGNFSSNSVETILAAVLAGIGIGLLAEVTIGDELGHPDVIKILEGFVAERRDVSLVWPKRRFVPARVRRVTDYMAAGLAKRLS